MEILLYWAYASNNSGSYTIVGSFQDEATAESVAQLLAEVTEAHTQWHKEEENQSDTSPLDAFVQLHQLRESQPGRDDDWPNYGDPPTVLASAHQVIVYAPYTVTLPRLYGEFFYARGGRVQVELNHTHDGIAAEFTFWGHYDDPHKKEKLDAFEARLRDEIPSFIELNEQEQRPKIEPAWYLGGWGERHLAVVFSDLLEGVAHVKRLAKESGVELRLDVRECVGPGRDPFAHLRMATVPGGNAKIILWQIGERIAAMKAVREVLGCGLTDAKKAIEDLPAEILDHVDMAYGKKSVEILRRAGCDAEVVVPVRRDG